jgi:arabinose-5-phosphate isomerase
VSVTTGAKISPEAIHGEDAMTTSQAVAQDISTSDGLGAEGISPDIRTARRVLDLESNSLRALAASLDGTFSRALDVLEAVSGRVIVSGMGKSGHVAGKIAATLASTGTPAFFVHPAEASHGDLGMVTKGDAVVALSNSGETAELADLVQYTKRHMIPLISITGRDRCSLAEAATAALVMPAFQEACPMGLAPTTSTTMMMAVGDALAVALLERRGFSADDFQVLHPGGRLGRRLLKVEDIMHAGDAVPLIDADATMSDALLVMTAKSFGCIGVVDAAGKLVGIVTDGDLRRHMSPDLLERRVGDIMTPGATTIGPRMLSSEAVHIMNNRSNGSVTSLFVEKDDRPVGIIHIHDCLRAGVA